MPDEHFYRFPTVDFFGKSMPGVLFTLLSLSLLPYELVTSTEVPPSMTLAVVVTAIFVVLVVGFTVGQALNTVTIVIQKSIYWLGLNLYRFLDFVGIPDNRYWAELVLEDTNNPDSNTSRPTSKDVKDGTGDTILLVPLDTVVWNQVKKKITQRTKFWLWKRYVNFKRVFVPHRKTFENRLKRHLARKKPENYPNVELFEDRYSALTAELDGRTPDFPTISETAQGVDIPEDLYTHVSSYLTYQGVSRSQRHKALYVFCRNTASVLFIFATIYAFMSVAHLFVGLLITKGPDTFIATVLHEKVRDTVALETWHLSGLLFGLMINFLYSTGEYKRYYIEYMIADFNHTAPKRRDSTTPGSNATTENEN